MSFRILIAIAVFFGVVFGPVAPSQGCAPVAVACKGCCAAQPRSCCTASELPAKPGPAVPASSSAQDSGKQVIPPAAIFLCLSPIPVAEQPAVQRLQAARLPALPLLDLNCVRLI